MVKPYDVIKWQNVRINTLALSYTTSNQNFSLVYLIYLNLFKDHFWLRDLGLSTARREIGKTLEHLLNLKAKWYPYYHGNHDFLYVKFRKMTVWL